MRNSTTKEINVAGDVIESFADVETNILNKLKLNWNITTGVKVTVTGTSWGHLQLGVTLAFLWVLNKIAMQRKPPLPLVGGSCHCLSDLGLFTKCSHYSIIVNLLL